VVATAGTAVASPAGTAVVAAAGAPVVTWTISREAGVSVGVGVAAIAAVGVETPSGVGVGVEITGEAVINAEAWAVIVWMAAVTVRARPPSAVAAGGGETGELGLQAAAIRDSTLKPSKRLFECATIKTSLAMTHFRVLQSL
jgi:hypothetical protein